LAAGFGFALEVSAFASVDAVVPVRFRPRPPRLPRRRFFLVGSVGAPGSAGGAITVSVGAGVGASGVWPRSSVGGFCRRNHRSKWILLVGRARFQGRESGGARAAMWLNLSA
jgi:hypothetical protein